MRLPLRVKLLAGDALSPFPGPVSFLVIDHRSPRIGPPRWREKREKKEADAIKEKNAAKHKADTDKIEAEAKKKKAETESKMKDKKEGSKTDTSKMPEGLRKHFEKKNK